MGEPVSVASETEGGLAPFTRPQFGIFAQGTHAHHFLEFDLKPGTTTVVAKLKEPVVYAPGPYYTPHVTPLAGLRAALSDSVEVYYAKGCAVLGDDRSGFAEAMQAARDADVAIVVVAGRSGLLRSAISGEGNDAYR